MKRYYVTVNASPKYPVREGFHVTASTFGTAIARAVKMYFKKHTGWRTDFCDVRAQVVGKVETVEDNGEVPAV